MNAFYNLKTIAPTWKFYIDFFDNSTLTLNGLTNPMPALNYHHVLSVSLPQYDFKKEVQKYGMIAKTFPVLEYDGLELRIEFEEDREGTIGYFINWLQRRVIQESGLYNTPSEIPINKIVISQLDKDDKIIGVFIYSNCYFLNSSELNLDYASNDSVKYNVTFNADYVNSYFPTAMINLKQLGTQIVKNIGNTAVNLATSKIGSLLRG